VLNTDDRPVVANRAPRITYAPDSVPRDRLLELLQQLSLEPIQLVDGATDSEWTRLSAYWRARDEFLAAGRNVRPSADVRDMLAQVREPLLAVLGTSPDFRPAYDPLLDMAEALATVDPAAACRLLGDLSSVQPARPEAATAMSGLSCPSHNCVAGPCEASCPDSRKLHERLPHPQ
jgi:spermidine synthase